jgi:hypothetical protein
MNHKMTSWNFKYFSHVLDEKELPTSSEPWYSCFRWSGRVKPIHYSRKSWVKLREVREMDLGQHKKWAKKHREHGKSQKLDFGCCDTFPFHVLSPIFLCRLIRHDVLRSIFTADRFAITWEKRTYKMNWTIGKPLLLFFQCFKYKS